MKLVANIVVAGFFMVTVSVAQAAPRAIIASRFSGQVTPNSTICQFGDDAMNVSVMDGGKKLADRDFCSTFGVAKATAFTTRSGHIFVLVEVGEGRGTNATVNKLVVYRLRSVALDEVLSISVSWPTGPKQRFSYGYTARDDLSGGLVIKLEGRADSGSECCVPTEKAQTVRIDP